MKRAYVWQVRPGSWIAEAGVPVGDRSWGGVVIQLVGDEVGYEDKFFNTHEEAMAWAHDTIAADCPGLGG